MKRDGVRAIRFVGQLLPVALVGLLSLVGSAACAEDWPCFRGPSGMGQTTERGLPLTWGGPTNENVLWKVPLPSTAAEGARADHNQSSPIVRGHRIFVTTVLWPAGRSDKEYPEHHVTCYRTSDGKQLWDTLVPPGPWWLTDLRGGYGASTPAADDQRVYVVFGSSVIAALDFEGRIAWRQEISGWKDIDVCLATSPVVYQDTVLMLCDKNNKASTLTAYDSRTGKVRWEKKRPDVAFDHTTPLILPIDGKPQMLVSASNALQALDPATGEILWWCSAPGDVPMPVYGAGLVYSDSGRGGPAVAVSPTGRGDVTKTHVKWRVSQIPEGLSSAGVAGEFLYRLHNPEVLKCFKMATGEVAFTARLVGVSTMPSPVVTPEGRVYFASAGKSYVLQAGPKLEILATNDLGDPNPASAAISAGKIYLKGSRFLYCIGKK
ncbi:MAG: PQQ-binding-like beta-propeller repeat protein [Pirellulales bacterium]